MDNKEVVSALLELRRLKREANSIVEALEDTLNMLRAGDSYEDFWKVVFDITYKLQDVVNKEEAV